MNTSNIGTQDTPTPAAPSSFYIDCMSIGTDVTGCLVAFYVITLLLAFPVAEILMPLNDGKVLVLPPDFFSDSILPMLTMYGIVMLIVGGIPAMLLGAIGSSLLGTVYDYIPSELPVIRAYIVGLQVGTIFLTLVTIAVYLSFPWFSKSVQSGYWFLGIAWGLPCLIAIQGFGWISWRINQLKFHSSLPVDPGNKNHHTPFISDNSEKDFEECPLPSLPLLTPK